MNKGFRQAKAKTKGQIKEEMDVQQQAAQQMYQMLIQTANELNQLKGGLQIFKSEFNHFVNVIRHREVSSTPAKLGDYVLIDYVGRVENEAGELKLFEGNMSQGFPLELGAGMFIEGFEEGLVGAQAGDLLTLDVSFPESYNSKELAGKKAVFDVEVIKVLQKTDKDVIATKHQEYLEAEAPKE